MIIWNALILELCCLKLVSVLCVCCAVDAGHRAVIFDRFRGVQDAVVGEGTHFLIPWVQKPIVFDCRSRPRNVPVVTGSKGDCCQKGNLTELTLTKRSLAMAHVVPIK